MNNTTSIFELPTDPVNGGSLGGNINMVATEQRVPSTNFENNNVNTNLNISTINQIVSGIQQAAIDGATSLPSRDIPTTTTQLSNDAAIQPNYIPPPPVTSQQNYINEYTEEETNNMIKSYNKKQNKLESLDSLYDELQIPIMLGILYFIFQLPIVKKILFKYMSFFFFKDGNYNIYGYIGTSILFGIIYYIISKTMKIVNRF
jgi:hypothetical protein